MEQLIRVHSDATAFEPALFGSGLKSVDDFRARFGEATDWRPHAPVPPWAVVQLGTFHFFARLAAKMVRGRVPLLR